MKQFEIWATAGGTFSSKPRPSVIIQAVAFNDFESVTVIPITTTPLDSPFRVGLMPSGENGLKEPSFAMIDKITTIRQSGLSTKIGRLDRSSSNKLLESLGNFVQIK